MPSNQTAHAVEDPPQQRGAAPDSTWAAVGLTLAALMLFDCMGLIIKHLSSSYTAAELSAYRNFFGLGPSLAMLWFSAEWRASGKKIWIRQWKLSLLRGVGVSLAQLMYYLSLGLMAFATATTISYANALFMTALAVPLLGEKVGLIRWSAVAIGFVGVIWVMRPGADSFGWEGLLPLGAAFFYAFAGVSARMADRDVPTALFNLHASVIALGGSLVLALAVGGFSPLRSWADLGWIMAMGGFGGSAVFCWVHANRLAEPSNLAPFNYFGIPIAFFFGWVIFDEAPWRDLFPGALLIALGGLLIVYRERRRRRAAR